MTLEIHVADRVQICDRYQEAETFIVEELRRWQSFDDTTQPLTITIVANPNTGPPTLSVTVNDSVKSEDIFGRR